MVVAGTERYETRHFTADEVMRMVELGVLAEDERVELIEGELIVVTPQGPAHSNLVAKWHARLAAAYGEALHVRSHSPVTGTADSIPEPDIAVVRGDFDQFSTRLPNATDVVLIVEISRTSLALDRRKATVYASAGYETYWLIDLEARRVEMRSGPQVGGLYAKTEVVDEHATVTPPGATRSLRVAELLP